MYGTGSAGALTGVKPVVKLPPSAGSFFDMLGV
jgi:hypothetical protein